MLIKIINKFLGGKNIMIDLYVALIINSRRTFDKVPTKFQSQVHEELLSLGLNDDGTPAVIAQ
jgi:hypothetical protein